MKCITYFSKKEANKEKQKTKLNKEIVVEVVKS